MHDIARELVGLGVTRTVCNEPMAKHTNWRIGGPADLFVEPESLSELRTCVVFARGHGIPLVVIGHGTNLLVSDEGVRGIVLKIGQRLARIDRIGNVIRAEGGAWVPRLAWVAYRAGLRGIEHIIGIPGTIGGLVVMNGGSRRQSIGSAVTSVQVMDEAGNLSDLSREACEFRYRHSVLQGREEIVCAVTLELAPGKPGAIRQECLAILRDRRRKFPRKAPSCGSVFLSNAASFPQHGPPGKMLEEAGMKGFRIGDAQVSPQHANFVVNVGRATAKDVMRVVHHMRTQVFRRVGVELECEAKFVRPNGEIVPLHQQDP